MTTLKRLELWYESHYNGDWEHEHGIRIDTLDNPGWTVDIALTGTGLENKFFKPMKTQRSEANWIHCFIQNNCFCIRCGPLNLEKGLIQFLGWVEIHVGT